MRGLLVLVFVVLAAACNRPSREECDKLCWKYVELNFWAKVEEQAKDLDPADRETLRAERKAEWAAQRASADNKERDNCISGCRKGATRKQIACVDAAKTAADAVACMK